MARARLEAVDWAGARDAYGTALAIPGLLRRIRADDEDAQAALEELMDRIAHQGHVTAAAALTLPFLVELVGRPGLSTRAELIAWLGNLSVGGSHEDALALGTFELAPELRRAAREGLDGVLAALEGQPSERAAAGLALAMVGGQDPRMRDAVLRWLGREDEPAARASALLCAAVLAPGVAPQLQRSTEDRSPIVRAAAWLGLAWLASPLLDEDGMLEIAALLEELRPTAGLFWGDGDLRRLLLIAATGLATEAGALDLLWLMLDQTQGSSLAAPTVQALVRVVFEEWKGPRLRSFEELSEAQQEVLVELLDREVITFDARDLLWRAGLFEQLSWLERLVGRRRGPLDECVDGEPWWRLLNDAVNDRLSEEHLDALAAGLELDTLVELADDALVDYPVARRWPCSCPLGIAPPADMDRLVKILARLFSLVADGDQLLELLRTRGTGADEWCAPLLVALGPNLIHGSVALEVLEGLLDDEDVGPTLRRLQEQLSSRRTD